MANKKSSTILDDNMQSSSFVLTNKIDKSNDRNCSIPVSKYVSNKTGMRLYVCYIDGPVVEGYFSLSTEAHDDDGLPHTLEHMIFLGSQDYPYAGILDILANKVYAAGTNAWTDIDNTTYTISTIEKQGFLQLMPIYLDHILFPLLKESGFITEVYHVNGDGEDAGVVYSEMQGVENEDETIVERAMHRAMYPNEDCGYRYETGGIMKNLRTSTSHKKVCNYHKQMYKADNMAIIIAGKIEPNEIIQVLENFEKKLLAKNSESLKLSERPFSKPISPLVENIEQTVYFPSDQEENTNGIVSIGWRGPQISDLKHLISLDVLFAYLTESSISPFHDFFIETSNYCNKISYQVEEYRETCLVLNFINTQLEFMDRIKIESLRILNEICDKKLEFNMDRLISLIKTKISEVIDKMEDSPHDTISKICIGDFLYGNPNDHELFRQRFNQIDLFEQLLAETDSEYWLDLVRTYFLNSFSVTILARPCEKLMASIGAEDKQRVEERKRTLGKKGLKELQTKVDNSIEENDDFEVPDVLYKKIKVPSLENVHLKHISQYFTYMPLPSVLPEAITNGFNSLKNLNHLQMQVDHLEGTNFVQVVLMIDTSSLRNEQRKYLQLFVNLLFELPIVDGDLNLTREQAVYEINRDLLEFESSIGINGSEFEPGLYPQYLSIFVKTPIKDYELAIKWLKLVVFNSVFDLKQIHVAICNLLKEIKKRKTQPHDVQQSVVRDLCYKQETNVYQNSFLKQENFLSEIEEEIGKIVKESTNGMDNNHSICKSLDELRSTLLQDKQLRFYLCTDLNRLHATVKTSLDQIWLDMFPSINANNTPSVFGSNKPFEIYQTWKMKKNYLNIIELNEKNKDFNMMNGDSTKSNEQLTRIWSQAPKKDYIVSLGSTESSFLRLTSTIDIHSYKDPNYAALLVLIEYFTQTEGPIWESVRGPGYCYNQSISLNPETGQLDLFLDECSNLVKAYEAVQAVFNEHLGHRNCYDSQLLETAKNSLIFLLIDELKSVSNYSAYSMCNIFKGVNLNAIPELIKKIEKVDIKEMKKLLKTYIIRLFNDEYSNCIVVCHPSKTQTIIKELDEKLNRKLNLIGKVDECLCSLEK